MHIKYRPEIDGLRAVAILSVIFYHAQITIYSFQPFKGGFVGVDIFFVISGYLITSIILNELITTKAFLFKNFYKHFYYCCFRFIFCSERQCGRPHSFAHWQ